MPAAYIKWAQRAINSEASSGGALNITGQAVGSIGGKVTINAGKAYRQVGSDVLAPAGDITISAKKVPFHHP